MRKLTAVLAGVIVLHAGEMGLLAQGASATGDGATGTATTTDAAAIRAEVARQLADAKPQSKPSGATIVGENGYTLKIEGLLQFRYIGAFEAGSPGGEREATGFQTERIRVGVSGELGDPSLSYRVLGQFSGETFTLLDAWTQHRFSEQWSIRAGQFKLPFDRERFAISSSNLLAAERSIMSSVFGMARGQGVQVAGEWERVKAYAAFSDGQRSENTDFTSELEADWAVSGRIETRLGEAPWSQFQTLTAYQGDAFGVLIGGGVHYQEEGTIRLPTGASRAGTLLQWTADVGLEGDGWSLMGAFYGRTIETDAPDATDLGFLVQGALAVGASMDVFARYAMVLPDDDRAGEADDFSTITVGANYYFVPRKQVIKLTAEATYFPTARDESSAVISAPSAAQALLPDAEDGQIGFIVQVQLLF